MDENNYITNCKQTRNRFNNLIKKIGQKLYSDSTINKCFLGLVNNNLLLKQKSRGLYQVSPLFFFKGTEEKRAKVIRKELEELNKVPINKYRREQIMNKVFFSSRELPVD